MQAVQPRPFGRRRVPPSLSSAPPPENPALVWARSQVDIQQGRLQAAAHSARPLAGAVSTWVYTLASTGVPLSGMAFAGCVAVGKSVFARLSSVRFRPIRPRRTRPVPPSNPLLDAVAHSWRGVFIRTLAYLGGIATLSVIAAELFQSAPVVAAVEPAPRSEWTTVGKPFPAFDLILPDTADDQHYAILRHGEGGGRKDILSWGDAGETSRYFMVEIYRAGGELDGFSSAIAEIGARAAGLASAHRMRESLPIETKFGPVSTVDFNARIAGRDSGHCVGFVRAFDEARVQISGLSCDSKVLVDRNAMACAIDRLTLMSAGSDPGIAKLFAQAELKRNFCGQRDPILYATPRRSIEPSKPLTSALRGRLMR